MKTLKEKLREQFHEWVTSSSSHGIPNIFRTQNIAIRLMWVVVFLGSFGYCVYTIVRSLLDFFKYETSISIGYVQELPQTFPAVTFCNLTPFRGDVQSLQLQRLAVGIIYNSECIDYYVTYKDCTVATNLSIANVELCNQAVANLTDYCLNESTFDFRQLKNVISNLIKDGVFNNSLGHNIDSMLQSCTFNGNICSKANFSHYWDAQYGNCYTFNSDKQNDVSLHRTSDKGAESGLKISLAISAPQEFISTSSLGLYLVVHNQSTSTATLKNGIRLSPGKSTYVAVNRVFTEKLPAPYSDCIDELSSVNAYQEHIFELFKELNASEYDQDVCFHLCHQDKLIDKCNCSNVNTPSIRNTSFCYKYNEINCMDEFDSQYYRSDLNQYCESACPQKCNTISYELKQDFAVFPSISRLLFLKQIYGDFYPSDEEQLLQYGRTALLEMIVNYDNIYYTTVVDSPSITLESLFGNIGGQLGLFIGISFLSFIEVLELLIELTTIYRAHRKEEKKKTKTTTPKPNFNYKMYPFFNSKF